MKIISYVNNTKDIAEVNEFCTKVKELGCTQLYEEDKTTDGLRPMWSFVQSELTPGDTLVVYSMYDITYDKKECIDLLRFFVDSKIRIISIFDELDSKEEIYKFSFHNILKAVHEVDIHHPSDITVQKVHVKQTINLSDRELTRSERYSKIINMYAAQCSIEDIAKATGYSVSQVNKILTKNNIKRDRSPMPEGIKRYTKRHVKDKEN